MVTTRKPRALPKNGLRSEGQSLLWRVRGSIDDIARATGAGRQSVHNWRSGALVPSPRWRARLEEMYAIPVRAWVLTPSATGPANEVEKPEVPPDPPAAPATPPPGTLEGALALHARVCAAAAVPGLTAAERVKLSDTEAKVLALRHRLEREAQMVEARIIREHPRWRAVRQAIATAIAGCPRCTKLVADALMRLDV